MYRGRGKSIAKHPKRCRILKISIWLAYSRQFNTSQTTVNQRCPWIASSVDWIGLGQMTVMYKIMTVYVFFSFFQLNRPRLYYI